MEFLYRLALALPLLPRDIYNHNAAIRRESRHGNSLIKALVEHFNNQELLYRILLGEDNRV
jgi:hypothetical protein